MTDHSPCRLAVDIGGTFTDVVLESGAGRATLKVLTTPEAPELGLLRGIDELLGSCGRRLSDVGTFVHGTTLATNAIIERKGARTALITTAGFRDVLEIGTESRYDQYELALDRSKPLVPRPLRFTVRERIDARGGARLPLHHEDVAELVSVLARERIESVAIAFIHAYANPTHEQEAGSQLAKALPDLAISLSSAVCPEIREYERTSTTVANAYVQPAIRGYLDRMVVALRDRGFQGILSLMTSGGGLASVETARAFPVRLIESGPAGGAIFATQIARMVDARKVLAFDMGGTTAKVSLIDDFRRETSRTFEVDRAARFLKGSGLPIRVPCIDMVEIGAGGGSLATVNVLNKVVVGPDSAASDPGPACYGRGGIWPTVTDADAVLGLVDPTAFAGGSIDLDVSKAAAALRHAVGERLSLRDEEAAYAVFETVCENMANAARVHCVERGADPGNRTIIAFGGAAPLHVARVAEKIGAECVIIPSNAGVGSAVGFLAAPVSYEAIRTRYVRLDQFAAADVSELLAAMSSEVRGLVLPSAVGEAVVERRTAHMRYAGQGHEIEVELPIAALTQADAAVMRSRFEAEYSRLFTRAVPNAPIEVMAWAVTVSTVPKPPGPTQAAPPRPAPAGRPGRIFDGLLGTLVEVGLYRRDDLEPGMSLPGPAVIAERETSTFVPSSFDASIDASRSIILVRKKGAL